MKTREEIVERLQMEYEILQHTKKIFEKANGMSDKSRAEILYEYEVRKSYLKQILTELEIPIPEHKVEDPE